MSGRGSGQPRPGPGGRTKSGKPRPGTGGYGKRRLEGKGPTPPAQMRPGHPAQRRGAAAAAPPAGRNGSRDEPRPTRPDSRAPDSRQPDGRSPDSRQPGGRATDSRQPGGRAPGSRATDSRQPARSRGSGSAPELIAGRNAVLESLRAAVPAIALHVGPRLDADERISEAITLAADLRIPVVEAGRSELDRLTGGAIHQGLALRVRPYSYAHADDLVTRARDAGEQPLIVALDGVTDPRNLGAIVRSATAFGGHGVLVPVRRSAGVTAGAWKASAGTLARTPVAQAPNLVRALAAYQEAGLFVAGLDAGAATPIDQLDLADGPLVLVIGSEGKGLSRLVEESCDEVVRIPIRGPAESLNAGIAAGIALYEVSRLRLAGQPDALGE
ncbi:MAG: 23S rRNA (guanosine(2251)-2'-O)-methyltransferase RlmB [Streptosporangiaceae bacterium]